MAIYVLGKVAEDLNKMGIDHVRKDTDKKANMLYDFAKKSDQFDVFVENESHRSATVVVLNCKDLAGELIGRLKEETGMVVGAGYGKMKETQIRIANFPAVDVSQVEALIDHLKK
jgi:phosphoserine aminotransferase